MMHVEYFLQGNFIAGTGLSNYFMNRPQSAGEIY
jgi:hypothetical protein